MCNSLPVAIRDLYCAKSLFIVSRPTDIYIHSDQYFLLPLLLLLLFLDSTSIWSSTLTISFHRSISNEQPIPLDVGLSRFFYPHLLSPRFVAANETMSSSFSVVASSISRRGYASSKLSPEGEQLGRPANFTRIGPRSASTGLAPIPDRFKIPRSIYDREIADSRFRKRPTELTDSLPHPPPPLPSIDGRSRNDFIFSTTLRKTRLEPSKITQISR